MKRFSEQLHKKSESLSLKMEEKNALRERLVSYMEYHPLPANMKATKPIIDPTSAEHVARVINLNNLKFWQWSGVTMVVLLLVVPYVAEKSVPGDMLYAVKVNFNEEVRSGLALNSYDKVVWETERLNRRIAEARLLASEGKMTEELENSVAEAVRIHGENAKKEIEELKQTDEGEAMLASIQLDTTIAVQSSALRSDMQSSSTDSVMAVRIVDILAATQDHGTSVNALPSRERLIGKVEAETTRAYELLNSIEGHATEAERSDIKRRLEDIGRKTEAALQTFEFSESDAQKQMLEVLKSTQRLIVFMTNINVRSSLTVDQVVPVTLTREERVEAGKKQVQEGTVLINRTKIALTATTSAEVEEKVKKTLDESETELKEKVIPSLENNDFDLPSVETKVKSLYDVIRDSRDLIGVRDADLDILIKRRETSTTTNLFPDTSTGTDTATKTNLEI